MNILLLRVLERRRSEFKSMAFQKVYIFENFNKNSDSQYESTMRNKSNSKLDNKTKFSWTVFQDGRHFTIFLFHRKLALLASFKAKYSVEFYF